MMKGRGTMRQLQLAAAIVAVCCALLAAGCKSNPDLQTEVIAAKTMVCGTCEKNIKKAVYQVEGVKSVDVDLKAKTVTVAYLPAQTNLRTLERAITDAGYDANDKRRDPAGYEKLDACCKTD
jgi:copper chaperone CopZ